MRGIIRGVSILCFVIALAAMASPVQAQKTGDHIVPAIETVCDGDPFSFGLCNAYCEALDCESDTPLGTPRACSRILTNYMKKSDGVLPPCEVTCPCSFTAETLLSDQEILDQTLSGNDAFTGTTTCGAVFYQGNSAESGITGPTGEEGLLYQGANPTADEHGEIYYYFGVQPDSCEVLVELYDIQLQDTRSEMHTLLPGEKAACQAELDLLCP